MIGVRQGRIAHPNPYEAPSFDNGISPDYGPRRNVRLAGNLKALAVTVEDQPVVAALERVIDKAALAQRKASMRTAIFEAYGDTVFLAKKYNRFVEEDPAQRTPFHF